MKKYYLITLLVLVFVTACSNSSGPSVSSDSINQAASFVIGETLFGDMTIGIASGAVFSYGEDVTLPNFDEASDQCFVNLNLLAPDLPGNPVADITPTFLDVGSSVTIKSNNEDFAILTKQVFGETIGYTTELTKSLADLNANASLSIPESDSGFPEFLNVMLPEAPTDFTLSASPSTDNITKTSRFTWQGDSSAFFTFSISGEDAQNEPIYILCNAKDDGDFSFSATIQAELDAAGFTKGKINSASRLTTHREVKNKAAVQVTLLRTKNY